MSVGVLRAQSHYVVAAQFSVVSISCRIKCCFQIFYKIFWKSEESRWFTTFRHCIPSGFWKVFWLLDVSFWSLRFVATMIMIWLDEVFWPLTKTYVIEMKKSRLMTAGLQDANKDSRLPIFQSPVSQQFEHESKSLGSISNSVSGREQNIRQK